MTANTAHSRRYVSGADVLFRELAGEAVLLNLSSGVYYGLDRVGTQVWTLLADGRTVDEACATLVVTYDVSLDVLRRDVAALVATLCETGLVNEQGQTPRPGLAQV
jgi:hypothetical protein